MDHPRHLWRRGRGRSRLVEPSDPNATLRAA